MVLKVIPAFKIHAENMIRIIKKTKTWDKESALFTLAELVFSDSKEFKEFVRNPQEKIELIRSGQITLETNS